MTESIVDNRTGELVTLPDEPVTLENGNTLYPNGTIRDKQTGKIIRNLKPNITRENAREYQDMRREKAIRAISRGIMTGTDADTPYKGIELIAASQARLAMDISRGRASTDAFKTLLISGGFLPRRDTPDKNDHASVSVIIPNEVLIGLAQIFSQEIEKRRGRDTGYQSDNTGYQSDNDG